jgi:hypothetical protein
MRLKGRVGRGIYRVEEPVGATRTVLKRGECSCTTVLSARVLFPAFFRHLVLNQKSKKSQQMLDLVPTQALMYYYQVSAHMVPHASMRLVVQKLVSECLAKTS